MATKVFTDTSIIIDLLQQRPFDVDLVLNLVSLAENGSIDLYISESVITNTLYITKLNTHIERLLSFSKVICINEDSIITALHSGFTDKEDAILYFGALNKKLDYFITRNPKDFTKHSLFQLPVVSIKQFFKLYLK